MELRITSGESDERFQFLDYLDSPAFSDVTLVVEDTNILCHRIILQSSSRYFKTVLDECMKDSRPIIILDNIQYQYMISILQCMYTGEVTVTQKSVEELIKAARYLEIDSLVETLQLVQSSFSLETEVETQQNQFIRDFPAQERSATKKLGGGGQISVLKSSESRLRDQDCLRHLEQDLEDYPLDEDKEYEEEEETVVEVIEDTYVLHEEDQNKCIELERVSHRETTRLGSDSCSTEERRIYSGNGPQFRKNQSKVWDYFLKTSEGESVVCLMCGIQMRYKSNTTTMTRHVKRCHQELNSPGKMSPTPPKLPNARRTQHRSAVWKFFIKTNDKVKCTLCKSSYKFSNNTSNLWLHLKTKHNQAFHDILEPNIH